MQIMIVILLLSPLQIPTHLHGLQLLNWRIKSCLGGLSKLQPSTPSISQADSATLFNRFMSSTADDFPFFFFFWLGCLRIDLYLPVFEPEKHVYLDAKYVSPIFNKAWAFGWLEWAMLSLSLTKLIYPWLSQPDPPTKMDITLRTTHWHSPLTKKKILHVSNSTIARISGFGLLATSTPLILPNNAGQYLLQVHRLHRSGQVSD